MVQLTVSKINKWKHTLVDVQTNKEHVLSLEFYGLKRPLKVGDQILIHNQLLDPSYKEYSMHYAFGPVEEHYGREIASTADIDAIGIKQGNDVITLKRFYG